MLVCDDEPVMRMLVRATLESGDYTIVEAADGNEALALARSESPDLILLDVMMPGRSGAQVLAELRGEPATSATPVVVISARAQNADRQAMQRAGADHYLTKPFSPDALSALVADLLSARTA